MGCRPGLMVCIESLALNPKRDWDKTSDWAQCSRSTMLVPGGGVAAETVVYSSGRLLGLEAQMKSSHKWLENKDPRANDNNREVSPNIVIMR